MGFSFTTKTKSSGENWGMGLLLVFFPDDDTIINKKKNPFSSSSSSSSSSPSPSTIRRTNSNPILTRAQSTISICALLVFITLLLFTLSTFEPTIPETPHFITSRRFLSEKNYIQKSNITHHNSPPNPSWVSKIWSNYKSSRKTKIKTTPFSFALQGMGTLFMRGTRAMNDLIVVHVVEDDLDQNQLRFFLRLLHRSGLTAKADIVFIFPSLSVSLMLDTVIREENDSFLELICRYREANNTATSVKSAVSFDVSQYLKKNEKGKTEPIWGRKIRGNGNNSDGEVNESSYGSVVGFDAGELDPENSLSGFLEHVPMSLRKWACYPMLLGRVRRNYKHIMLVDMKNMLILGDPLVRVRNKSPESVHLWSETTSTKHKKHTDKTRPVNSAVILGGSRGVRRLSNAMLTEIVRATMQQRKGRNSVTESGILNQLVRNEFILKDVKLVTSSESIPETSSLTSRHGNAVSSSLSSYSVVQRGSGSNYHDINSIIMKAICSSEVDSSVYRECEQVKNKDKIL